MRLYLNCFEEYPWLWSIDDGTIETERKYKKVHLGEASFGCTNYDLTAKDGHPKCWIEFDKVQVDELEDGEAHIW